ncbi:hypothetical protein [Tranquillimonas alkanivorans]|uniref:Uncharacterized protein n=1 Tax=Tranquillimonas alkanivorans TaxID=441119 RepID=A0A1I5TX21_9RHOB|nr:hypothetical protein [Tranquillimonas alkanivorans]SFP87147.1 hypothetical protein SAMN04488047_11555 [Tranquillimonas alkanivorans]
MTDTTTPRVTDAVSPKQWVESTDSVITRTYETHEIRGTLEITERRSDGILKKIEVKVDLPTGELTASCWCKPIAGHDRRGEWSVIGHPRSRTADQAKDALRAIAILQSTVHLIPWHEVPLGGVQATLPDRMALVEEVIPETAELDPRVFDFFAIAFAQFAYKLDWKKRMERKADAEGVINKARKKLFDALPTGTVLFSTQYHLHSEPLIGVISEERGGRTKRTLRFPQDLNPRHYRAGEVQDLDIHARNAFRLLLEGNAGELEHLSAHKRLSLLKSNEGLAEAFAELA